MKIWDGGSAGYATSQIVVSQVTFDVGRYKIIANHTADLLRTVNGPNAGTSKQRVAEESAQG